jgi:hypothetical protein
MDVAAAERGFVGMEDSVGLCCVKRGAHRTQRVVTRGKDPVVRMLTEAYKPTRRFA